MPESSHLCALDPGSVVLMGPTASGKTALAVALARQQDAWVASVDSRQVYRGLDLCSGKDREEYGQGAHAVEVRGLDMVELGGEYSLYSFAQDARQWAAEARSRRRSLIWCGGSSLYLDALLRGYRLVEAPRLEALRHEWASLSLEELGQRLRQQRTSLHNVTDLEDRGRVVRALEVALAEGAGQTRALPKEAWPGQQALLLVVDFPASDLRERIRQRLRQRLEAGMVQEVAGLLEAAIPEERLHRLGLEARWILRHLRQGLELGAMEEGLAREIWQFARSQLSWLRRFERMGLRLQHLDGLGHPLEQALELMARHRSGGSHVN